MSAPAVVALLQAKNEDVTGIQDVNWSVETTIGVVNSQTNFTLSSGSATDDFYNGMGLVLEDSDGTLSAHHVTGYTGASKTVVIDGTPGFTIVATDSVQIQAGWPESALSTSNFPQTLVRKSEGNARKVAGKLWATDTFEAYCFLAKQHQNTYTQAGIDAQLYIQRLRETYADPNNFTLQGRPSIVQVLSNEAEGISDTGLVEIDYLSTIYYGFILSLIVQEKEP